MYCILIKRLLYVLYVPYILYIMIELMIALGLIGMVALIWFVIIFSGLWLLTPVGIVVTAISWGLLEDL